MVELPLFSQSVYHNPHVRLIKGEIQPLVQGVGQILVGLSFMRYDSID